MADVARVEFVPRPLTDEQRALVESELRSLREGLAYDRNSRAAHESIVKSLNHRIEAGERHAARLERLLRQETLAA